MAVIEERTTIEPRHRPAIRASLRAYRRAIEAEAAAPADSRVPCTASDPHGECRYANGPQPNEWRCYPAAPAALDVDAMATAFDQHLDHCLLNHRNPLVIEKCMPDIAAEYARLASEGSGE